MPKGYIISAHRSPADPVKREAYTKIAVPAFEAHGGKILAKASEVTAKENGVNERTILNEFESYKKAIEAYESEENQRALKVLDGGSDRDFRIFEGV